MKTHLRGRRSQSLRLLVLVPHRDTRLLLRGWSASLFKTGFCGAYSFPWAAPLAILSGPLNTEELKHCARVLREASMGVNGGKISAGEVTSAAFPADSFSDIFGENGVLFGPCLNLELPPGAFSASAAKKIAGFFSPLVIGACLGQPAVCGGALPPPPQISFRAAALANMSYRSLHMKKDCPPACDSHEWKIGKLCWLPKV